MHRAVPPPRTGGSGRRSHELRERWRTATMAAGWPYPSDWGVSAVDAVCEAAVEGRDPAQALSWLGRARAETGAGLGETLHDLAALYAAVQAIDVPLVTPDAHGAAGLDGVPTGLIRATALGWADIASGEIASGRVVDELTGLVTAGYLRTRLGEIYRSAQATGRPVGDRHVLVLVAVDLSNTRGWSRLVPMLMAAEAMRAVFDGGQTLALVGPSVAAVLCRRNEHLPLRTMRLRRLATELLATDPDAACAGPVRIWLERLPSSYHDACDLLAHLGR